MVEIIPKLVQDVMTKRVITIEEDKTALDAARLMANKRVGCLPIVRDNKPIGIVSLHDVIGKVIALGLNPKNVKLEKIMSKPVIECFPTTPLADACYLMKEKGVRKLVVVNDKGEMVGILTEHDIIHYAYPALLFAFALAAITRTPLTVKDVMHDVTKIDENVTAEEATKVMDKKVIGSVLVTRRGEPIGMLTERDILRKIVAKGLDPRTIKVKQVMCTPLITIPAYTSLDEAGKMMAEKGIRRLPVVDDDKIVGIVTARDLMRGMSAYLTGERKLA